MEPTAAEPDPDATTALPAIALPVQLALADDLARADEAERRAYARNTQRAYLADLAHFGEYAADNGLPTVVQFLSGTKATREIRIPADPIAVDTVRAYLSRLNETHRYSTVERRVAAIKWWHRHRDLPSPTDHPAITRLLKSYASERDEAQIAKKKGLELDLVAALADAVETSTALGKRNRALLLLGFALGLRRSELAALRREDTQISAGGLTTRVRKSKTDQRALGRQVAVRRLATSAYCPVAAVELWLNAVSNAGGPLFRSFDPHGRVKVTGIDGQDVYRVLYRYLPTALRALGTEQAQQLPISEGERTAFIKRFVANELAYVGEDELSPQRLLRRYGAHSLRRGYITSARSAGLELDLIAEDVGHKSLETTRGYVEAHDALSNAITDRIFEPLARAPGAARDAATSPSPEHLA